MRSRLILPGVLVPALAVLAACSSSVPDSAPPPQSGVGFGDYNSYLEERRARDAALAQGRNLPQTTAGPSDTPADTPPGTPADEAAQTANDAVAAIRRTRPANDASAVLVTGPTAGDPPPRSAGVAQAGTAGDNAGISDEQDFDAVSARQTIESDAERRRRQSAQYRVVEPEALPSRPRNVTMTPVEYAVSTSHGVGQQLYRRSGGSRNFEQKCASYSSNELAQDAFLREGGPERDKLGLDPDGDGFACGWSPVPYR